MPNSNSPSNSSSLWHYYERHRLELEDFWARERSKLRYEREFPVCGRPVRFLSNEAAVLAAADLCRPQYSTAPPVEGGLPFTIELIVDEPPVDPGPVPEKLVHHIHYSAGGDWMSMRLGAWGHCHLDLPRARAVAVLAPALAGRAGHVSQWVLNTILTNLLMAHGLAMLHATCLVRGEQALLLMAPHNSGKSTTALRLVLAGSRLLTDSQVYVAPAPGPLGLHLMGFPVGRVKLRRDMIAGFPELEPLLAAEQVRHEKKYALDLRQYNPALVQEAAFVPRAIDVCLLSRTAEGGAGLRPAQPEEVLQAVVLNSLHTHTDPVWQNHLAALEPLVAQARWHHLEIGSTPEAIVPVVETLWQ